jgi:signal transduction histidine kinase
MSGEGSGWPVTVTLQRALAVGPSRSASWRKAPSSPLTSSEGERQHFAGVYQTIWFQGLCVLAGAGVLRLLYRLRLRQMTAKVNLLYQERRAERTRIAHDLHDTLLQSLAGVSLQLDGISKQAARSPERTASLIARVREQVDSAFREARVKVWSLESEFSVDLAN